jgi:hypothetical protein
MLLIEALSSETGWLGSLDGLAAKAAELSRKHPVYAGHFLPPPTRWIVVSYRSAGILAPARGKRFHWLHLVQLLCARWLMQRGMTREAVAQWMQGKAPESILKALGQDGDASGAEGNPQEVPTCDPELALRHAFMAVRLLSAGIVEQFQLSRGGAVLVHDSTLSPTLVRAMSLLASLHIMGGREDTSGSVHDLVERCSWPLEEANWGLSVFSAKDFPYRGLRLIDPDARIPTLECVELARQTQSELDLMERLAFEGLLAASELFVLRPDEAYSMLRRFIAEHPCTAAAEIRRFEREHNLQLSAGFLDGCYSSVQPHHLANGLLHLCPKCRTPMGRARLQGHVSCKTRQCAAYDEPLPMGSSVCERDEATLVAKPHILAYWIGPAIDELALFQVAQSAGLSPVLYPDRDSCDLSLDGGSTGIDVKSHANPYLLAEALSRSLHGLAMYEKRVVAVNDQSIARFDGYLEVLRREYKGPLAVDFVAVASLMQQLGRAK